MSPYSKYFNNKNPNSFTDPENICVEEFAYMSKCLKHDVYLDWPNIKGAVYVEHCKADYCMNSGNMQQLIILNTDFINNDAGPVMDRTYSTDLASSLYIIGGFINNITSTRFMNHSGSNNYYTEVLASKFSRYFPSLYYKYA